MFPQTPGVLDSLIHYQIKKQEAQRIARRISLITVITSVSNCCTTTQVL